MTAPAHVAIIMDGNGRWAKARGLPRVAGHRAGVEALRQTVRAAGEMGIGWLTVYAFSSENWSRPKSWLAIAQLRQFPPVNWFAGPCLLDYSPLRRRFRKDREGMR